MRREIDCRATEKQHDLPSERKGRSISRPTAQSKRDKKIDCVMQVNEACLRYGNCRTLTHQTVVFCLCGEKSNNLTLSCEPRANEAVQADADIMRSLVMLVIKTRTVECTSWRTRESHCQLQRREEISLDAPEEASPTPTATGSPTRTSWASLIGTPRGAAALKTVVSCELDVVERDRPAQEQQTNIRIPRKATERSVGEIYITHAVHGITSPKKRSLEDAHHNSSTSEGNTQF